MEVEFFKTVATEESDKSEVDKKDIVCEPDRSEDCEVASKMAKLDIGVAKTPEAYKPSVKRPVKSAATTDLRDSLSRVEKCLSEW